MNGFHDVNFPFAVALGASGGPERRTEITQLASGREVRNAVWAHSRRRWDAGPGVQSREALDRLLAFFEARRGRLYGFRFRDPLDQSSAPAGQPVAATDQALGAGDGTRTRFALTKTYASGGEAWHRPIHKPVVETLQLAVDGMPVAGRFDSADGAVVLDEAPAPGTAVTAGFRFDCPVRFDTDHLEITLDHLGAGSASVPLIELRF